MQWTIYQVRQSLDQMEEQAKLHLGCGSVYKPGFVNVDMKDGGVADVVGDVLRLPFADESVARIEAFHVIEHFDLLHCRYLLAEWFRVLSGDGTLVIETPDIKDTLSKFVRADLPAKEKTLQWIFGIDSPGLSHKTGFIRDLLSSLLKDAGFGDIVWKDQETHTYEEGMRVVCRRIGSGNRIRMNSRFRGKIMTLCADLDSFALIPVEPVVRRAVDAMPDDGPPGKDAILDSAAMLSVRNPSLALAFVAALEDLGYMSEAELASISVALRKAHDGRLHNRIFSVWMSSRREAPLETAFSRFAETVERDVGRALSEGLSPSGILSYAMSKEPTDIPVLEFEVLMSESNRNLGLGLRLLSLGKQADAATHLRRSVDMNPLNLLAQWNLGRALIATGADPASAAHAFRNALAIATEKADKKAISGELKLCEAGDYSSIPVMPVAK